MPSHHQPLHNPLGAFTPILTKEKVSAMVIEIYGKFLKSNTSKYLGSFNRVLGLVLVVSLGVGLQLAFATFSTSYTVTKTDDTADGSCSINDCSLREAIIAANETPGTDTINLPEGVYHLTRFGPDEDAAMTGDLDIITGGVTIVGAGAELTVIDGVHTDRVLHSISGSFEISIFGVTIQNGGGLDNGGGIYNNGGMIRLTNCSISLNKAGSSGGGIYNNNGTLILTYTLVSFNDATEYGGGIYNVNDGQVTLTKSIIQKNTSTTCAGLYNSGTTSRVTFIASAIVENNAGLEGGGIYNDSILEVTNSTLSSNTAFRGGGISNYVAATTRLTNGTIANNISSVNEGGGLFNNGSVTLLNSIIAGNSLGIGNNCGGLNPLESGGNNIESANSCGLNINLDDQINTDPLLGVLRDNGGTTLTHAILENSPAIEHGSNVGCPPADQRSYSRIGTCDVGAYEFGALPPTPTNTSASAPTPTPSPTPTPTPTLSPTPTSTLTPTPTLTPTRPFPYAENVYLPLVLNKYCPNTEIEPNDKYWQAQDMLSGISHIGCHHGIGEDRDYFRINMEVKGSIEIVLENADPDLQLHLYYQDVANRVGYVESEPFIINCPPGEEDKCTGDIGTYYVMVYTPGSYGFTKQYILRATYP